MAHVRAVLNFVVAGALFAVLVASWVGPRFIAWDNTPGSGVDAMCLCSQQALQGAQWMIAYQMRGCAIGAGLGLVAGVAFVILRRKRAAALPPTV